MEPYKEKIIQGRELSPEEHQILNEFQSPMSKADSLSPIS